MNGSDARPTHDESADEDLSTSLAGHSRLPDAEGDPRATARGNSGDSGDEAVTAVEGSPVLDEIEDSPVRTENS